MTVREHLAEEILDFLPEMVRTGIRQANVEHRRHLLERLTQTSTDVVPNSETSEHSESDPSVD